MDEAQLARIEEESIQLAQPIEADVTFRLDSHHRPVAHIALKGVFAMVCQRCLEPMNVPFEASNEILILDTAEAVANTPAGAEVVVAEDDVLNLLELVVDEVLVHVPFAPRHEDCEVDLLEGSWQSEMAEQPQIAECGAFEEQQSGASVAESDTSVADSPFAALAGWKAGSSKGD